MRRKTAAARQVPLRLGWCRTVHGAQSLEFDEVDVDLAGQFGVHQAYVAMSRAKSASGLLLRGWPTAWPRADAKVRLPVELGGGAECTITLTHVSVGWCTLCRCWHSTTVWHNSTKRRGRGWTRPRSQWAAVTANILRKNRSVRLAVFFVLFFNLKKKKNFIFPCAFRFFFLLSFLAVFAAAAAAAAAAAGFVVVVACCLLLESYICVCPFVC